VCSVQVGLISFGILCQCVVQEGQAEVGNAAQPVGAVLTQYGKGENQGSDGYGRRREEHGCRLCRCRIENGISISLRSARWAFR
jgi:hypothetical protein